MPRLRVPVRIASSSAVAAAGSNRASTRKACDPSLRRTEVHYIDYGRQGPCPETPADLAEAQGNIEAIDRLLAGPPWRA